MVTRRVLGGSAFGGAARPSVRPRRGAEIRRRRL